MEITIMSKTVKQLDTTQATTSSQIFEIDFAKALAKFAKVNMVSLQASRDEVRDGVFLYSIQNSNKLKKSLENIITKKNLFSEEKKVIIAFGYDFLYLNTLRSISKKHEAKLLSFTFDSHKGELEHKKGIKRVLIDYYFILGSKMLNRLDGILLFQEEAYRELKLNIPHLTTKVGINSASITHNKYKRGNNDKFKLLYAGSLTKYNGIKELIESMNNIPDNNVSLTIFGDGPLKEYVIKSAVKDQRIKYEGVKSKREVETSMGDADLLINLRDINHYITKFAFPSKLVQYLSSGIPILTTKVLDNEDFNKVTFVVDEFTPEKIGEQIKFVINNPKEQEQRSINAIRFVRENFLWDNVIKDVYNFLDNLD